MPLPQSPCRALTLATERYRKSAPTDTAELPIREGRQQRRPATRGWSARWIRSRPRSGAGRGRRQDRAWRLWDTVQQQLTAG
jgi:hypothetical protein